MKKPSNIPPFAKRPYSSPEFDLWEWPQKMFDGSTKTFRRIVQQPGVSIFAAVGNKVVVLKQQQPRTPWYYSLPGGAADKKGESYLNAAKRELLEESGYLGNSVKLWKHLVTPGRVYHERYIYVAQNCKKVAELNVDHGEKIKVELMTFDQLLKLSESPQFFKGDIYIELLRCRANKKYANSLKQALFGKK